MPQSGLVASDSAAATPAAPARPADGFRLLAVVTAGLTLVLIAIGGLVRSTDSGLACPDWPRCYGMWVPPADVNIWIEHTHRLVAGVVAVLIWVLAAWALARHRDRRDVVVPVLVAWVLVHVQALLGALVVWHLLRAELVTAHLGMAMVVVACLVAAATAVTVPPGRSSWTPLGKAFAAVTALAFAQILVGGHVTGIGASLAFTDFPTMGGTMLPSIGTEQEAFHVLHRVLGFALLGAVAWLAARVVRFRREAQAAGTWTPAQRLVVRLPMWAATLIVVQIALGVANLWSRASYLTVTPHLAVASWIWVVLVLGTLLARRAPEPARAATGERR